MSGSPSSSTAGGGDHPSAIDLVGGRRSVIDPSSSRTRSAAEAVWPQHFVEAVAARVAVDAAETQGRLAAAPAIATVFQVCSTWRSVSRSELLWEEVSRRVWSPHCRLLPSSWYDEFRRHHRTALNFRNHRCTRTHILPPSGDIISCRRLTLSDSYLAAGFSDGTVRLFFLPTGQHLATYGPHPLQARLGLYSLSISGLVLLSATTGNRLAYAFQDGDVHVASLDNFTGTAARRANVGNPVEDGPLVDFSCNSNSRWWVGLFAGVPGRSWHVWDGDTEQLVYVGGMLTDPDSVIGWHMLTDLGGPALGRVRIPEPGIAVGCTGSRIQVIDLDGEMGGTVSYREFQRGAIVDAFDACDGKVMVVDQQRRMAKVRMARSLEEVCRFRTARRGEVQANANAAGCMNWGYAVMCSASSAGGGEVRMWDAVSGEFLYRFRERIGGTGVVVGASDRYVSAWSADAGLHIWDFGGGV